MKKIRFIMIIIISLLFFNLNLSAEDNPSREINIVYDDSSSMIQDSSGTYVDYWAKAKYSLELFTSSIAKEDIINIYPMSDYSDLSSKAITDIAGYSSEIPPKLTLDGNMSAEDRVTAVDNMVTDALGTPFYAVGKAFLDLTKSNADEKWLVIVTDGKFDEVLSEAALSEKFKQFYDYDNDVKIMYVGMNSAAFKIEADEDSHIYTQYTDNSNDILTAFSTISYRIFNRNQLDISEGHRMDFDVPMKKVVVFAQGDGADLGAIVLTDGTKYEPTNLVKIPVSKISANNYLEDKNVIVDNSLTGVLAEYDYDISEGNYRVEVENSDSVEVFYYPNVGLDVNLIDSSGTNVYGESDINSGTYKVEYKFTNTVTQAEITNTELLGNITFNAKLLKDGVVVQDEIKNGDTITLVPGEETLSVSANYLKYNTVENNFDLNVVNYKLLQYAIVDQPAYSIGFLSGNNLAEPFQVSIKMDGKDLDETDWNKIPLPTITSNSSSKVAFKVAKSEQIGIYNVTIDEAGSDINQAMSLNVNIEGKYEDSQVYYKGLQIAVIEIADSSPFILKIITGYWQLMLMLLLVVLLGLALVIKSMPKVIYFKMRKMLIDNNINDLENKSSYNRNEKFLRLEFYPFTENPEWVIFNFLPTESLVMASFNKSNKIAIKNIETSDLITEVTIGRDKYVKVNNAWILEKFENAKDISLVNKQKLFPTNNIIVVKGDNFTIYGEIQRF